MADNDDLIVEDEDATVKQLRSRIKKLRQLLSEKTEEEKDKEGEAAEKDREELANLHHENKTKSDSYEDDKEAIAVDAFTSKDEEEPKDKED